MISRAFVSILCSFWFQTVAAFGPPDSAVSTEALTCDFAEPPFSRHFRERGQLLLRICMKAANSTILEQYASGAHFQNAIGAKQTTATYQQANQITINELTQAHCACTKASQLCFENWCPKQVISRMETQKAEEQQKQPINSERILQLDSAIRGLHQCRNDCLRMGPLLEQLAAAQVESVQREQTLNQISRAVQGQVTESQVAAVDNFDQFRFEPKECLAQQGGCPSAADCHHYLKNREIFQNIEVNPDDREGLVLRVLEAYCRSQ